MYIHHAKKVASTQTSKIMNQIFNKSSFKISDEVDKFIYMGLFNKYSSNMFKKVPVEINKLELITQKDPDNIRENWLKYKEFELNDYNLNLIMIHL